MGLVHTTQYLDFPSESWKILSNNPTIFEALDDNLTLNIRDVSRISKTALSVTASKTVGLFDNNFQNSEEKSR